MFRELNFRGIDPASSRSECPGGDGEAVDNENSGAQAGPQENGRQDRCACPVVIETSSTDCEFALLMVVRRPIARRIISSSPGFPKHRPIGWSALVPRPGAWGVDFTRTRQAPNLLHDMTGIRMTVTLCVGIPQRTVGSWLERGHIRGHLVCSSGSKQIGEVQWTQRPWAKVRPPFSLFVLAPSSQTPLGRPMWISSGSGGAGSYGRPRTSRARCPIRTQAFADPTRAS